MKSITDKLMLGFMQVDHKTLSFKARVKPDNHVWMEDARLKNLVICQPEYRNRFNKVGNARHKVVE